MTEADISLPLNFPSILRELSLNSKPLPLRLATFMKKLLIPVEGGKGLVEITSVDFFW